MAIIEDSITATNSLTVGNRLTIREGNPVSPSELGAVFADFFVRGAQSKVTINGRVSVGNLNPVNMLEVAGIENPASQLSVAGGAGIGTTYAAQSAPSNGLIVEGALGVGTLSPIAKLDVNGGSRVTESSVPGPTANSNVGIGTATPIAKLQVSGGAIMPSVGNSLSAGILFPANPGGGAGDQAWIRYFVRTGDNCTLDLGIGNEAADHLALMPSGYVGIGTLEPVNKLDVMGDIAVRGKHALRGNDAWLRLNQDLAFTGVHTPALFAAASLNVGGAGAYSNPGGGSVWVTGTVAIGTVKPSRALHVHVILRQKSIRAVREPASRSLVVKPDACSMTLYSFARSSMHLADSSSCRCGCSRFMNGMYWILGLVA